MARLSPVASAMNPTSPPPVPLAGTGCSRSFARRSHCFTSSSNSDRSASRVVGTASRANRRNSARRASRSACSSASAESSRSRISPSSMRISSMFMP